MAKRRRNRTIPTTPLPTPASTVREPVRQPKNVRHYKPPRPPQPRPTKPPSKGPAPKRHLARRPPPPPTPVAPATVPGVGYDHTDHYIVQDPTNPDVWWDTETQEAFLLLGYAAGYVPRSGESPAHFPRGEQSAALLANSLWHWGEPPPQALIVYKKDGSTMELWVGSELLLSASRTLVDVIRDQWTETDFRIVGY